MTEEKIQVLSLDNLTPDQVDAHMKDTEWSQVLEKMIDLCLEDSDNGSLKVAYALISMFVQTSYVGMLFENLQSDAVALASIGQRMRQELLADDSEAAREWDGAMEAIENGAKEARKQIESVLGQ